MGEKRMKNAKETLGSVDFKKRQTIFLKNLAFMESFV